MFNGYIRFTQDVPIRNGYDKNRTTGERRGGILKVNPYKPQIGREYIVKFNHDMVYDTIPDDENAWKNDWIISKTEMRRLFDMGVIEIIKRNK